MQTSPYVNAVPAILAEMEKGREEDETTTGQKAETGEPEVIHVYPLEGGGLVFTTTPIEDKPEAPIVDSQEPETDKRPTTPKEPPYFLHFLLLLLLFLGLDSLDSTLTALFTPTVTVVITPQVKTISTRTTLTIGGTGAAVQGQILAPLTITQKQTVNATGRGHQDAKAATGQLTFYNGQLQSVTIASGTVFTGRDGIQIETTQAAVIPAADPSTNPPTFGQATISAQAVQKGTNGNIQAYDVSGSCCAASVIVKNLAAFTSGQDARNFTYVTKGDVQGVVSQLTPHLLQSERAAFTSQISPDERLVSPPCTPSTATDHQPGDEAAHVTISVSETCTAIVYNTQELQTTGTRILNTTHTTSVTHLHRVGDIHLVILSQTVNGQRATLKVQLSGTWVYQLNKGQLTALIVGKPRIDAIHLIEVLPGVQSVSITGIHDNEQVPTDAAHIHVLIFFTVS